MHLASNQVQSTGSKWLQMAQKYSKMVPNDYGWLWQWPKIVPNSPKRSQIVQNYPQWSNIVQNCQIWSQIVLNGLKGLKKKRSLRVKHGPKMFNMLLNGLQCSQMVLNGLKKDHKFKWMPFITRFKLDLVWYKIDQIFY